MTEGRQYEHGNTHPSLAGLLAVVVLTGAVVLQRLDATLGAMQRPGAPSATATGLASPSVLRDIGGHYAGVQAWAQWDERRTSGWDSQGTLLAYVFVDCLLVAVPLGGLLLLLNAAAGGPALRRWRRSTSEAKTTTTTSGPPPWEPRALLASVPVAAVAYVVFDVLENLALLVAVRAEEEGWLWAVGFLSIGKWVGLATAVLPLVAAGLAALTRRRGEHRARRSGGGLGRPDMSDAGGEQKHSLGEELIALRAQLAVVAILVAVVALSGELGKQIDDALLALPGRGWAVLATVISVVLLCVLMESSGRWCLRAYRQTAADQQPDPSTPPPRLSARLLWVLFATGLVALLLGLDSLFGDEWVLGAPPFVALLVPGGLLLGFVVFSLPARSAPVPAWGTRNVSPRALRWVSVAPLLAVGLVAVRTGVLVLVMGQEQVGASLPFLFFGITALGIAVVVGTGWWERIPWPKRNRGDALSETFGGFWAVDVTLSLAAVALAAGWWGMDSPLTAGPQLGTWTLLLVFLMLLLSVLTLLVVLGDWLPVRGILAAVGFRRVPMIAVVAVCTVVTSMVDTDWRYHDTRLVEAQLDIASATVTLQDATKTWLESGDADAEIRPLVLIAASGGGIRAAYWTSAVLSCVFSGSTGDVEQPEQPPGALVAVPENDPLDTDDPCAVNAGLTAPGTIPETPTTPGTTPEAPTTPGTTPEVPTVPNEDDVLIASGISGSSVGLVVRRALGDEAPQYTGALADDFLAANMAAYFFRDVPNSIFRRLPYEDRSAVLEHAWEEAVERSGGDLTCGLLAASRDDLEGTSPERTEDCTVDEQADLRFPLLLLNSVGADDGCRITASTLDLAPPVGKLGDEPAADGRDCRSFAGAVDGPFDASPEPGRAELSATRDAHDHTCGPDGSKAQDLPLSTAAHLSARFPYVSPTGRLLSCAVGDDATYALDGGVIESSAASPLNELWPALVAQIGAWNRDPKRTGPCVVPRLMLLDNGYASFAEREDATRPLEATAPLGAVGAVQGLRTAGARQALALAVQDAQDEMGCPGAGKQPAVAHFYPVAHPGPQAPLGWTLSEFSRDDLRRELNNQHNRCQLAVVRSWFDPDATTAAPAPDDPCEPKQSDDD